MKSPKTPTKKDTQTCTIGLDLGDAQHTYCVLDTEANILSRGKVRNDREPLALWLSQWPGAKIVMEAGTHSPWISRLMQSAGHKVILANARKTRAIWQTSHKDDERDAETLARLGRADVRLLHPLKHRSEQTQRDQVWLKNRETLVKSRASAVTTVRGLLKSLGIKLPAGWSTESFAPKSRKHLERAELELVETLLQMIECCNAQIKTLDAKIASLIEHRYPIAQRLQSVRGVGPITALSYVLIVEDPARFGRNRRSVGHYLGLTPKRDQSGVVDKQLRITKEGPATLRRLLVSCAHYIMGPFGEPCALREAGERIAQSGGKNARKRAIIAVARKLSVLLLALWQKPQSSYEPYPQPAAA